MSTARFTDVVARSGRPKIHLTWVAPAGDQVLQSAIKQSRVMTVHQAARGARKDFGMVGFETGRDIQYLVFPRSLRSFQGRRVVGIRYELVDETLSSGPSPPVAPRPAAKPAAKRADQPQPKPAIPEKPAPAPSPVKAEPRLNPIKREPPASDENPVKAEIRRALADLSAGKVAKVRERLTALLRAP